MPCACQGNSSKTIWVYQDRNGTTKEYGSQVQAQAAVIRNGGGTVKAVSR
jgi:hypothetical protein